MFPLAAVTDKPGLLSPSDGTSWTTAGSPLDCSTFLLVGWLEG